MAQKLRESGHPADTTRSGEHDLGRPWTSIAELAATVAHDVNNPLAVVSANLEFLGELVARIRLADKEAPPEVAADALAERLAEAEICLRDAGEAVDRLRAVVLYVARHVIPQADRRARAARTHEPESSHAPSSQRSLIRRVRVLVIDDDEIVARALRRTLRGYDVTMTLSAVDALDRLKRGERFDAILCDLMMPQMTGHELYAEVSRAVPEQAERMIFVTGGGTTPQAHAFLAAVTNPVVDKPFDVSKLRELIRGRMR